MGETEHLVNGHIYVIYIFDSVFFIDSVFLLPSGVILFPLLLFALYRDVKGSGSTTLPYLILLATPGIAFFVGFDVVEQGGRMHVLSVMENVSLLAVLAAQGIPAAGVVAVWRLLRPRTRLASNSFGLAAWFAIGVVSVMAFYLYAPLPTDPSSTASLGFLFFPLLLALNQLPVLALGITFEWAAYLVTRSRGREIAGPPGAEEG